jgi:hypothetical protein
MNEVDMEAVVLDEVDADEEVQRVHADEVVQRVDVDEVEDVDVDEVEDVDVDEVDGVPAEAGDVTQLSARGRQGQSKTGPTCATRQSSPAAL